MTCEKLRPLFIAFTGDMINKDRAEEWVEWLDDWQKVISKDGHVIPIVAHRGNHERRPETIHHHFDTPMDAFFAFSIGGELFRYYTLNSEIPATGGSGSVVGPGFGGVFQKDDSPCCRLSQADAAACVGKKRGR